MLLCNIKNCLLLNLSGSSEFTVKYKFIEQKKHNFPQRVYLNLNAD